MFVLFFVHRREIVLQARKELAQLGIKAGVILAGEPTDATRRVQVASIQTLHARCIRGRDELPPASVVVVDECHHVTARTYRAVLARYPEAQIIGLTATPCRRDGRGLGGVFSELIEGPQVAELIEQKHLVKTKVFAPSRPDLAGVHTRHGDYVEGELADRMDRPELVGDIVSHWLRLADRRKTVVFATSVAHSIHLCEEFCKAGVKAEHIDGATPKEERDEILKRLAAGRVELVTNCAVLTEGWDCPEVGCIVLARPTRSLGLYRQMVGRGLRPAPNKDRVLILDHAGAVFQHGLVEEPIEWTLDPERRAVAPRQEARASGARGEPGLLTCSQCSAVRRAGQACPECGFQPRRRGEHLDVIDGELSELRDGVARPIQHTAEQQHQFRRQLAWIARERGYQPGWVAYKFREKFGTWPARGVSIAPTPASPDVLAWVRSRQIAYAKARERAAANG